MSIVYEPDIAYFYISAILDKDTCQVCRKLDGLHILNDESQLEKIRGYEDGIKTCTSSVGCRCCLVGVFREEKGADEIASELREAGGVLPKGYFEEKERKRLEKVEEKQKREWEISQLYDYGRHFEKTDTTEAIKAYTSVINGFQDVDPTHLLRVFSRLSLCYEREKKYRECLETIRRGMVENNKFMFHRFTKADVESLSKRFDRCKKKCPRYNKRFPRVFNFGKWLEILYGFGFDNSSWEEVSADFMKRFGRRPSLYDVAWTLFNEAIIDRKNSGRLHSLYNHMADFLEEEGREGSKRLRDLAENFKR